MCISFSLVDQCPPVLNFWPFKVALQLRQEASDSITILGVPIINWGPHCQAWGQVLCKVLKYSKSTLKFFQVQVQVHSLFCEKDLSKVQVLLKVLKYKYKYMLGTPLYKRNA